MEDTTQSGTGYLNLQGVVVGRISRSLLIEAPLPAESTNILTIIGHLGAEFMKSQIREDAKRVCWVLTAGKDWYGTPVTSETRQLADFKAALYSVLSATEIGNGFNRYPIPPAYNEDADRFHQSAANACKGRKLFFTESGNLGLGPMAIQEGDILCVLFGGSVPYVLRAEGEFYRLVGECYVHDLMNGEAIASMEKGELEKRWFKVR